MKSHEIPTPRSAVPWKFIPGLQKVVGGSKAQIINLLDELALGVAVGDISSETIRKWSDSSWLHGEIVIN